MKIDIKDLLVLDDNNEYVVVSKTIYNNKTYYYLMDINNNENIKFLLENGDLEEIEDKILITKLLPRFLKEIQKEMDNTGNNNE